MFTHNRETAREKKKNSSTKDRTKEARLGHGDILLTTTLDQSGEQKSISKQLGL